MGKYDFAVIGKDGRGAAIVNSLRKSKVVRDIYCIPGNASTCKWAYNVPEISVTDINGIKAFVKRNMIKYVIPSPEAPLALGVTNALEGIAYVFGPSKAASILERSKVVTKDLCYLLGIPTARYRVFHGTKELKEMIIYLEHFENMSNIWPLVIKLDGLEEGKGVEVCKNAKDAKRFIKKIDRGDFKNESNKIIVEEFLRGREISFTVMIATDGSEIEMETATDYKRAYDNDEGANTGGMGAYSPALDITPTLKRKIMIKIINPLIGRMRINGRPFVGFFYAGLMICGDEPHLLEVNVRLGDPEGEVILPRLKSDFGKLIISAFDEGFEGKRVYWDKRKCVTTVRAAKGYPGKYRKGFVVTGMEEAERIGAEVYFAGAKFNEKEEIITDGGRVAMVTGKGVTYDEARNISQKGASLIQWPGAFNRTDIAKVAVEWERRR